MAEKQRILIVDDDENIAEIPRFTGILYHAPAYLATVGRAGKQAARFRYIDGKFV